MLSEDQIHIDRITTLTESLRTAPDSLHRKRVVLGIVRACVSAMVLKDAFERESVRETILELFEREDANGRQYVSSRIRFQIIVNMDAQLEQVDQKQCSLGLNDSAKNNPQNDPDSCRDEEGERWTPDFLKILRD